MLVTIFSPVRRTLKSLIAREGDPEVETETETETETTQEEKDAAAAAAAKEILIPQTKVNEIMAAEKRKTKAANDKLVLQLTQLQQSASLTAVEKKDLEDRIEELRNASLTKEQLAQQKLKETQDRAANEVKSAKEEASKYKNLFEQRLIQRDILDAAEPKGHKPAQFIPVLAPHARAVEILSDTNQPTGEYEVKIKLPTIVDGKRVTLDLNPTEAVAQLEKDDSYANFFKSFQVNGTGFNPSKHAKDARSVAELTPEEYRAQRHVILGKPKPKKVNNG